MNKAPAIGDRKPPQLGADLEVQAHLGRKLRELFVAPSDPLPPRLVELLGALTARATQRPVVSKSLKDALLALIPNLRAFAFSLCGNRERADDLVQETLLKAWSHIDSFQEGTQTPRR
jgi:Sigma-70 region 2